MEILQSKTYTRGGVIYIDTTLKDLGRMRFSTKLKASKENLAKVCLDIQGFIYKHLRYEPKQKALKYPIKHIAKLFLRDCGHLKAQTLLKYQSNINDFVSFFKERDVRLLTQKDLEHYAKQCEQNYKIHFLNRLVRFLKDEGIATHLKPLRVRAKHKEKSENIMPFSESEIKQILLHAQGSLKTYLIIAFFTGARTGEILALNYEDLDFKNHKISINKSKELSTGEITSTKTHQTRYIDMLELVCEYLEPLSLNKKGQIINISIIELRKKWYALLKELNITQRAIYQTRHSFATLMLDHKEEVLWISSMLGHKSLQTTFTHYVKYIPQQIQRASFLNQAFGGVL